ncbi:MAG: STAS/SEC14 domain-containing protein [Elusimicrobia bacterium]|nr:STAS/SEC14 domain-containing protein [Candidatus Liberimonas magnetica]
MELREVSEREIWVGETKIYSGEDNILYITAAGDSDEKMAAAMREVEVKFINMAQGKVNLLIDINRCGKQSPEARKIRQEVSDHEKVGKVAVFGMHPVARVIASFVISITKRKNNKFFKNREDALAWLKE